VNQFVDLQDLEIGGHTDVGRRDHNEDTFLIDRELGLVVVADGVGGHQSGEIASELTCEVIQREITAGANLAQAIDSANREVIAAVETGKGKPGMGSTVVAFLITEHGYELAWVGDSRAYLWDGKLSLLTRDHSFVEAQLASGQISLEEARTHPRRNVILQAVGLQAEGTLDIGINSGQLAPDTCLLLCSDGLTDPLDNAQLSQLLNQRSSADETCHNMVEMALQGGGRDNTTAVLIVSNSSAEDSSLIAEPARVVWVYDPETADYEAVSESTVRQRGDDNPGVQTQVQRVKPASTSSALPADLTSGNSQQVKRRSAAWRYFWLAVLLGTLAIGLAYGPY
jgi:serine/threonine protein phosphatase PrpC